jgi:hypothetical protein
MSTLFLTLILFVSSPFLLVALAMKSKILLIVGLVLGFVYAGLFLLNAFSEFLTELRATAVDEAMDRRLHALWKAVGPEHEEARFWIYPSSDAQFKVWMNGSRLEIFFSQGLLSLATDSGLKAAFQSMAELQLSDIKLQNRRHALTLRFERLKGPKEDFRYWFLSFWLYPLERWLKIAKI